MATFNKFNQFVADLAHAKHNCDLPANSGHSFRVMLTNTAPTAANAVKSDITEITAGNGYVAGGIATTVTTSSQTSGTFKAIMNAVTFTASGGAIGPFRYAVLFNDSQTAPVKPLVGFWDYGSPVTLADGEQFIVSLDQTNGVFQLS